MNAGGVGVGRHLDQLVGAGGPKGPNAFGLELATDYIRPAEHHADVPASERIPVQPRESAAVTSPTQPDRSTP